jgi:5-methylcytosine-specific restriction endonuclease McrA
MPDENWVMAVKRGRRAVATRRRKRRMARVEHDLSNEQWSALQAAWRGCAYCGATSTPLQRDCLLPVSRGGRYTLENVVPACRSCNTSKCNHEITGWLRRKRLDENSFLLRHLQITAVPRRRFDGDPTTSRKSPHPE